MPGTPRRGLTEYRDSELIGAGFRSLSDVRLNPGQKVYITHNGREHSGDVIEHDDENDEVNINVHSSAFNEVSSTLLLFISVSFLRPFVHFHFLKHLKTIASTFRINQPKAFTLCANDFNQAKHESLAKMNVWTGFA